MITPDGMIRCDICGLAAPVCDMSKINITSYPNCSKTVRVNRPSVNVCNKCLPNLIVMLEMAIIETSQLMIAENGGITGRDSSYTECVRAQDGNEEV